MAVVMLPLDATAGAPAFTAAQTRTAFSVFLGTAPPGRPLGAISGVRPATPATTVFMSGGGSTTWNVATHSGVLDTQASAVAGPYAYSTDGTDTGAITAANGTNPRVDIIYVKVNDNVQDGSGLFSGQVLYLAGTAAASPVAPAVPARGMVLANINVPTAGGGAPTVSWVAPTFGQTSGAPRTQIVYKLADQSVVSSTTMVSDAELFFSVVAGQSYIFDMPLFSGTPGGSINLKLGFTFPTGTFNFGVTGLDPAVSTSPLGSAATNSIIGATSGTSSINVASGGSATIRVAGSYICTASGTVQFKWAQGTSGPAPLTIKAGSFLRAERVVA